MVQNMRSKMQIGSLVMLIAVLTVAVLSVATLSLGAQPPKVIDQGKIIMSEGGKRLSEESFKLFSDGSATAVWKSVENSSQGELASSLFTKNGKLVRASLKWADAYLNAQTKDRTINVLTAGRKSEISAPDGAYFLDTLLWHPWVVVMKHYDYKKGGPQDFPVVEPRQMIGLLTAHVVPAGIQLVSVEGKDKKAQHFTISIKVEDVTIGAGIELWISMERRLLKGSWNEVEVVVE